MEQIDGVVPLPKGKLNIAIVGNLKKNTTSINPDDEAEYDNPATVDAIKKALEKDKYHVCFIEADELLPKKLRQNKIDFVFNISEGRGGRGREAQVPAILNMMGIPYTGSDETTLCLSMDKALTKRLLASYRIKTPKYFVKNSQNKGQLSGFSYPVIVKPNSEGSSKGICDKSIAKDRNELKAVLSEKLALYSQEMLVEEYIEGREFTVGVLGNGEELRVFPPMEIVYKRPTQENFHVYSYSVKQNYDEYVSYECPPKLSELLIKEMCDTAKKIYKILGCRDFARIDFRLSQDDKIYFIEINPLPGLAPSYSDYPMLAQFSGVDYTTLVLGVFNAAKQRCQSQMGIGRL